MAGGSNNGLLRNLRFKVSVSVPKEANPETVFIVLPDIGRSHADVAVAQVVVGIKQVLVDIYPAHGVAVRRICPYLAFDNPIESLSQGRLLFALTGKVLDTNAFHQGLEVRVDEYIALVGL